MSATHRLAVAGAMGLKLTACPHGRGPGYGVARVWMMSSGLREGSPRPRSACANIRLDMTPKIGWMPEEHRESEGQTRMEL